MHTYQLPLFVIKPRATTTRGLAHEKNHGNKRPTAFGTNKYIETIDKINSIKLACRLSSGYFFKSANTQTIHGDHAMGISNQHTITISSCFVICDFRPREIHKSEKGNTHQGAASRALAIITRHKKTTECGHAVVMRPY